ncbi:hypothetical protein Q7C36_016881 [Tachysurus vachellii]|uniref:Uncharacterized protein n=1 Tax=Tachysurus vachellii TaxID=175792 RepID=A0AA88M6P5_TACVA|nr:hypothetical protein Q7C36_016881 [Tachysurus vachellii]
MSEDAALCVAVNGRYAAVGYHGNGLKLYNLQSGGCVWFTEDLRVSMLCLLWLQTSADALLLSGGLDQHLHLWREQRKHGRSLTLAGDFGDQKGAVLTLSQNSTNVASASGRSLVFNPVFGHSDDFTIALWLKRDLTSDPWVKPTAVSLVRRHSGGVTCLAFSPNGDELLSGGKDKVDHRSTLVGHSGSVSALASSSGPNFLTVSEDHSLRVWSINTDLPSRKLESVTAMCFLELQDVLVCGFSSGRLDMFQQLKLIYSNKMSNSCITALSSLPDEQLAVGCSDPSVSVWKLERDSQEQCDVPALLHHPAGTLDTDEQVKMEGKKKMEKKQSWESDGQLWLHTNINLKSGFGQMQEEEQEEEEQEEEQEKEEEQEEETEEEKREEMEEDTEKGNKGENRRGNEGGT